MSGRREIEVHTSQNQTISGQQILKLFTERRRRSPLPFAAGLETLTCFCGRVHRIDAAYLECNCGRRWAVLELEVPHG